MSAAVPMPELGAAVLEELRAIRGLLERRAAPPVSTPADVDPSALFTVAEAAAMARLSRRAIRSAIALKKLPATNPGLRMTRIRAQDLDAWLANRRGGRPTALVKRPRPASDTPIERRSIA